MIHYFDTALKVHTKRSIGECSFFKTLLTETSMQFKQIDAIARTHGIRANDKVSKNQLIKSIQISEGNFPCIATAYEKHCDQTVCRWREDCFEGVSHPHNRITE